MDGRGHFNGFDVHGVMAAGWQAGRQACMRACVLLFSLFLPYCVFLFSGSSSSERTGSFMFLLCWFHYHPPKYCISTLAFIWTLVDTIHTKENSMVSWVGGFSLFTVWFVILFYFIFSCSCLTHTGWDGGISTLHLWLDRYEGATYSS